MVQLIDLWVASLLPGDILDLTFEIVAVTADGQTVRSSPLDGLRFARGYIVLATHEMWWEGPRTGTPHGLRAHTIHVADQDATLAQAPASAPGPSVTLANLARVLPHVATAYPSVEWRSAPDHNYRSPLHAYLLALGLLCTACGSSAPGSPGSQPAADTARPGRRFVEPVVASYVAHARTSARSNRAT